MKKILLVDDNAQDRHLYRRYLGKQLGHERVEITEASSGQEAMALFASEQPDCVLLDYNLPDVDGLDLLAQLKQLAPPEGLCVVMITGGGNEQLAVQALGMGALDYLVKQQFDPELLAKTVVHAIEKNEWRQYQANYHHELQAMNQQLRDSLEMVEETRRALNAKNAQLTTANKLLARTNADLDNFVYAASHDLKQPVNNLRGLFDELRATATFADPLAPKMWSLADDSLRVLATTITDLASVVQEERQPAAEPIEQVALAAIVAEIAQSLHVQILDSKAVIISCFEALPVLSYSPRNLRTILLNLLANALKYRHPGRAPQVRLRTWLAAGHPVLEVQDNGLGIDLERHQGELFQLFRRFHPDAASGTGVGLFLVNRLVQAQGGHIEVASQPGEGTTFSVYLQSAD
ncbi:hybrid sensor histidine kinase/response regulator [Hymenobacter sp. H14-R3]|uniref:sensor histidine kinase n=1 Tax=Hymenobacter sp. H14-R3 TaxID=3046308 RepID=UPI0024BB741D|nr:hybrid sensor histidine kinase/response regulator [Hymenobacter sp. H14-R3]MDJ0364070.1 hybrid sensor histidine kinase/response regulator [Hymenobacter sp. H14-R3]